MANNIFSLNKKAGKGVPLFGKGPIFTGVKPKPLMGGPTSKRKFLKPAKPIPLKIKKIPRKDKDLNWTQASTKYRHLSPFSDNDKDGIQNWQDCRPLNKNMQGPLHNLQKWGSEKLYSKEKGKIRKGQKRKKKIKAALKGLGEAEGQILKSTAPTRAKEKARAQKRLVTGTLGFLGLISPTETKAITPAYRGQGGKRGTGERGRPAGSYKYSIPGKGPVHVYEYRKWARRQRALKRLQREPEYEEFEGEKVQAPQRGEFEPEPQEEQPHEEFTEGRGQYEAVQQDRGEMLAGEVEERGKSSILNTANLFNEEERANLRPMKDPVQHVDTVHKPVVNPEGDYYTDVDPLTGKPILQRRIRERWAEGE